MPSDLFVTGTDTGVGKTLLSAVLVAALGRGYWKPIQTGAREGTDRQTVMKWADVPAHAAHPEAYIFDPPVSPHLAARQAGVKIDMQTIRRPSDPGPIVVEGAGGVFVPINDREFMLDLISHLQIPVIVAARSALGTINHTLLTLQAIRGEGQALLGVVMIGKENADNQRAVEQYGNVPVIGIIPWLDSIDAQTLRRVFEQHFDKTAFA